MLEYAGKLPWNVRLFQTSAQNFCKWTKLLNVTQLTVGDVTKTTRVIEDEKYATFNEWLTFKRVQSDQLDVKVWSRDGGPAGEDHLMGRCCVTLDQTVTEDRCRFDSGQVSLIYVCTWSRSIEHATFERSKNASSWWSVTIVKTLLWKQKVNMAFDWQRI